MMNPKQHFYPFSFQAVCGRIETAIQNLPPPYQLNRPKLALVTSSEQRNQLKAPSFSINWTNGCGEVEIINSITGKTIQSKISRIAKQGFFLRYGELVERLPGISASRQVNGDYGELKGSVREYQIAKNELTLAFKREDLGSWLKKPIEQDQFSLPSICSFGGTDEAKASKTPPAGAAVAVAGSVTATANSNVNSASSPTTAVVSDMTSATAPVNHVNDSNNNHTAVNGNSCKTRNGTQKVRLIILTAVDGFLKLPMPFHFLQ